MKIKVETENGYLPKKYSKYAEEEDKYKGYPKISFPITFEEIPSGTKSFALTLIDFDAVGVCGFPWIHWIACDISGEIGKLPENISADNTLNIVQGKNRSANYIRICRSHSTGQRSQIHSRYICFGLYFFVFSCRFYIK